MSGATYLGLLEHIIDVVGDSGFQGIEAEVQFLGALRDPVRMGEVLAQNKVALASAYIVEDWRAKRRPTRNGRQPTGSSDAATLRRGNRQMLSICANIAPLVACSA